MGVHHRAVLALVLTMAMAPGAAASDPFYDGVCLGTLPCVGAGTCAADLGCVPSGCASVVYCRSDVRPSTEDCAVNETIGGATCATVVGGTLDAGDGTRAHAAVGFSNGSVELHELFNTWMAPGAEAELSILGVQVGSVFAYVYASEILSEGPRGGLFGELSPSRNHTWNEVGVHAGHSGEVSLGDIVVAVELLDLMPEGCFVRSQAATLEDVECPPLGALYPSIPLP